MCKPLQLHKISTSKHPFKCSLECICWSPWLIGWQRYQSVSQICWVQSLLVISLGSIHTHTRLTHTSYTCSWDVSLKTIILQLIIWCTDHKNAKKYQFFLSSASYFGLKRCKEGSLARHYIKRYIQRNVWWESYTILVIINGNWYIQVYLFNCFSVSNHFFLVKYY